MIARREDEDERFKYENYKLLEEGPERNRYTPKKSKYSVGEGKKRTFGVLVWDEEGKSLEIQLNSIWGAVFRDTNVRDLMSVV